MNITKKRFLKGISAAIALSMLIAATIVSCIPFTDNAFLMANKDKPIPRGEAPVDAFVVVEVTIKLTPGDCLAPTSKKACEQVVGKLSAISQNHSGSGLYVTDGTKNYVITAEHVCTEDTPEQFEHEGIKFKINKTVEIKLKTVKGKTYDAEVIGLEEHDDLCALKTENFTHPVRIADEPPKMGDKVFAIAAPYGLGGTNLALIFNGYYSGKRENWHYYSIPTRPGSSGSVVMNEDWEAVGVLHTAYIPLEHIGMGAGWYELRAFFNNLP